MDNVCLSISHDQTNFPVLVTRKKNLHISLFHDFFIGPDYILNSIFRRNGQLPASRAFTVQGPDGGNVLNVRAASPADGDEYFCLAENMAGSVRASATVTVHCEFYLDNNSAMLRTRTGFV